MKKLDLETVRFRTATAVHRLRHFEMVVNDTKSAERKDALECRMCFYDSKIGGAAMTNSNCVICDVDMTFGNTNVDALCTKCAKDHRLCKHCGADVELKNRNAL